MTKHKNMKILTETIEKTFCTKFLRMEPLLNAKFGVKDDSPLPLFAQGDPVFQPNSVAA